MKKNCDFGKEVKKKLVDFDKTQEWLISRVTEDTGLYFDSSYLHKILIGSAKPEKIISSIKRVLEMEEKVG